MVLVPIKAEAFRCHCVDWLSLSAAASFSGVCEKARFKRLCLSSAIHPTVTDGASYTGLTSSSLYMCTSLFDYVSMLQTFTEDAGMSVKHLVFFTPEEKIMQVAEAQKLLMITTTATRLFLRSPTSSSNTFTQDVSNASPGLQMALLSVSASCWTWSRYLLNWLEHSAGLGRDHDCAENLHNIRKPMDGKSAGCSGCLPSTRGWWWWCEGFGLMELPGGSSVAYTL